MLTWLSKFFSGLGDWFFGRWEVTGDTNPRHKLIWQQLLVIESFTMWFYRFIVIFIVLYSLGQVTNFSFWSEWARAMVVLGILVGVLFAATVTGGLLGFLFGLPKQVQASAPGPQDPSPSPAGNKPGPSVAAAFKGNSNLEEVSDWVTKIIVGLGLVEATTLYQKLTGAADAFKQQVPNGIVGADTVFLTIVIAASCAGFIVFLPGDENAYRTPLRSGHDRPSRGRSQPERPD